MRSQLERKLRELETELEDIYSMSEEAACFRYNVNNKEEILLIVNEDIAVISAELDELDDEDESSYKGWLDPAFRTMGDFDRMRV